jgi:hypothetical protein
MHEYIEIDHIYMGATIQGDDDGWALTELWLLLSGFSSGNSLAICLNEFLPCGDGDAGETQSERGREWERER